MRTLLADVFSILLFPTILLPDSRFQADSRLHGGKNQTVRLSLLDQLLGFDRIGAYRECDGRLQHDGRELKFSIEQFQLPSGRTLVRVHQTDVDGRDE